MIYFLLLFMSYAMLVFVYINNFELLLMRDVGLLMIVPGVLALIYYLIFQEMYQLYFGGTMLVIGATMLIII